ncbi:MAG: DUF2961 domain-containing protein [Planctomycetota bacterium]|nr:DUF2961 domain-containing protein [Planctomycetota bacterium]
MLKLLRFLPALLLCAPLGAGEPAEISYPELARRLTDLERLALLPDEGEKCAQWSSYDRASKYDEKTGKYVAWDANGDGGGIIRREGNQIVMAEMDGPGCIWRIWSAKPESGHVRIFLDGAETPAIDLPFSDYFNGKAEPFTRPNLVHDAASGKNAYIPIPYQKSCKVVAEPKWGNYYHFTYSTYPKGTKIPTFKLPLSAEDNAALDAAEKSAASGGTDPAGQRPGEATQKVEVNVGADQSAKVVELAGSQAITALRAKLDLPAGQAEQRAVLRELTLCIRWDGEKEPSVWAPLCDFFGTVGANPYLSLPLGLTKDGWWYSCWYMPFGAGATVELANAGKEARKISFEVTHAPLKHPSGSLGRFHAKWHRDVMLPQEKERWIDWPMLITEGRGRFCGVMLHVWNPKGGWWGEGDEKFFVDGEKFPSTIGTGSEDYFGYAWGSPKLFANAFHCQTISQNNKGHISVSRWHIPDNVPFQKSFEGDIEKYFPNKRPCLFACTAFWYLAPGGQDKYEAVPLDQRTGYYTETAAIAPVPGALEGEKLKVLSVSEGKAAPQEMSGHEGAWNNDQQLFWTGGKPGSKLELALPVDKAGQYEIVAQFTKAKDYGIFQASLDGEKLGDPLDLYNPNVVPSGVVSLGKRDLAAGEHKLTIEITGTNEKSVGGKYFFGLDCVKLK